MLNRQKLITLQSIYLKLDQISDNELKNTRYDIDTAIDLISFKETGKSFSRPSLHCSQIYAFNLICEKIAFMILKDFDLMMEFIYELWTDDEIHEILKLDLEYKETHESVIIDFDIDHKHHLNLRRSALLKNSGIFIIEIVENKVTVAILKKDMSMYAMEIIDNNPIEYIRI